MPARTSTLSAAAWGLLLCGLPAAAHAGPAAGHYEGRLCVATRGGAPECGPARVEWRSKRLARVRVSDMLYSLTLKSSQVEVVLKHGAMQIDGFTGRYEWRDEVLHFTDAAKGVRYEVQLGQRQRAQPREPR